MTVEISAKKVACLLLVIVLLLTLASVAGQFSKYYLAHDVLLGFVPEFDLDRENNIPTWYSSVTLLFCAVLLGMIAVGKTRGKDAYAPHWGGLSVVFLLLSIDEASSLHERSIGPVRVALHTSGFLYYYAWVIPGALFVLILGFTYLNFLRHLPLDTRRLFVAAAILYIGGAMGVEVIGGYYASLYGPTNMTYALITTLEELLEMMGVIAFLYALMSYLRFHAADLGVRFT
jgi:hypothetical protein